MIDGRLYQTELLIKLRDDGPSGPIELKRSVERHVPWNEATQWYERRYETLVKQAAKKNVTLPEYRDNLSDRVVGGRRLVMSEVWRSLRLRHAVQQVGERLWAITPRGLELIEHPDRAPLGTFRLAQSEEERLRRRRSAEKKYRQSEKGQIVMTKYRSSEKAQETQRRYQLKRP